MLQLSLSWLGRGPVAVSPWQLLLVVGTSLFLARILAWICAFYDNYCRLRCFPQPPSRHWFWGHLNLVKNNEEGLQLLAEMSHQFQDIHLCWIGIFYPILRLFHPKFIGPILQAPGTSPRTTVCCLPFLPALPIPATATNLTDPGQSLFNVNGGNSTWYGLSEEKEIYWRGV